MAGETTSTSQTDQQRLQQLIRDAKHPCLRIVTHEEQHALELIKAVSMGCDEPLWVWTVLKGVHSGLFEDAATIKETENPAAALFHFARQLAQPSICVMLDVAGHLEDARTLRSLRDAICEFHRTGSVLVLIDHDERMPAVVAAEATLVELSLPSEDELERLIRATLKKFAERRPIDAKLAKKDLRSIVRNLRGLSRLQAERIVQEVAADGRFDADDIQAVLAHKRKLLQHDGVLEFVEAPVDLGQLGGLVKLKQWLQQRAEAFSAEAIEFGLQPPRGVLLLGVQGAGKSLAAKAFATAWQRPLLRLDPGTLYDRFVGESERRLRQALHQAEMMSPIVLWIDEIEKGFASAASHSIDGGLSQRMFGTLLTWMQEHREPVFLVATANNVEALPPELLRKGRFDEIFFVDLPDRTARQQIVTIHLNRRKRDAKQFDVAQLADASEGFSGAEIEQAIIAALHEAFSASKDLSTDLVSQAMRTSPPLSVTMAEKVQALRQWASSRCVPAD